MPAEAWTRKFATIALVTDSRLDRARAHTMSSSPHDRAAPHDRVASAQGLCSCGCGRASDAVCQVASRVVSEVASQRELWAMRVDQFVDLVCLHKVSVGRLPPPPG